MEKFIGLESKLRSIISLQYDRCRLSVLNVSILLKSKRSMKAWGASAFQK
jgi:hypothetical protein